jgi:predicted transcriptional regulator
MIIPCEVAVKSVIPAVRALLAKELVEKHDMRQGQVAEILGVSQSAISKYTKRVRGHVIKIEDVEEIRTPIDNMITLLIERKNRRTDFLRLFCQTCTILRKNGLMCQLCQKSDSTIAIEECGICLIHYDLKRNNGKNRSSNNKVKTY